MFLVALLYSSVGHGGASGYLAVMSLLDYIPSQMAASALCLNLLVAAAATFFFWKTGYFRRDLFWPFAAGSIPFAWLGGTIQLSKDTYPILLAATLLFAAFRLNVNWQTHEDAPSIKFSKIAAVFIGMAIGLLSGMVGVGGGIFLSPLLILCGWAKPKEVAAVSAPFIWVNSLAGLFGKIGNAGTEVLNLWPYAISAFLGGCIGSYLGARKFNSRILKRLLAVVLGIAAFKLQW